MQHFDHYFNSELTEAVKCFDKQNEYCLTTDQRKVFQDFFNETKFFINDICKHGSTQTGTFLLSSKFQFLILFSTFPFYHKIR